MKRFLLLIFVISFTNLFATTYTSITNGDWLTYSTWSPAGIPQAGDDVIINHTVTIANDWQCTATITINQGGVLQEDQSGRTFLIQSGGNLINNGTFNYSKLIIYSGTFTNNGTSYIYNYIYSDFTVNNYGNIMQVDSFYTSGTYTNYANSTIESDSIYNDGIFINGGTVTVTEMFNDSAYTNNGTFNFNRYYNNDYFVNNGTINSTFDATNAGYWYNANNATIDLNHNFTNGDTSNTYHTAVFVNNGNFNIGDSWHNADTTKGASTGSFIVQNGSYNTGVMIGSFDFCDQTPITTTTPFIDYNTGTIDTNITYCSVGIKNNKITDKIKIYPVPSPDFINIESNIKLNNTLKVYNILGSVVTSLNINKQNNNLYKIDIRNLKSGIYFIKINNQSKKIIRY